MQIKINGLNHEGISAAPATDIIAGDIKSRDSFALILVAISKTSKTKITKTAKIRELPSMLASTNSFI